MVASLDPPKTAAAALRQQEQPSGTMHAKLLPGGLPGGLPGAGLPGGAAGLLSSGGLLALGGSLMTGGGLGGSNGSAAVAQAPTALAAALPAWAIKSPAGHSGSALADKTTPLGLGPILLLGVKGDVKQV